MANTAIQQCLLYDGTLYGVPCDGARNVESRPVCVPMGAAVTLVLSFRDARTFAPVLPDRTEDCATWRFEITDRRGAGHVCLFAKSSGIVADAENKTISVDLTGTYTNEMVAALGDREIGEFPAFLSGFDENGARILSVLAHIRIGNTNDDTAEPEEADTLSHRIEVLAAAIAAAAAAAKALDTGVENPDYGSTDDMVMDLVGILKNLNKQD